MIPLRQLPVGLLAIALSACSAQVSVPPGPGDAGPVRGGQLNNRVSNDPLDWDPSFEGAGSPQEQGLAAAYNGLLSFRRGPDLAYTDMVLQPGLAERWEVSPDAKRFTFHLRRGVKFANLPPVNGRDLKAADVRWSLEYATRTGEFGGKNLPPGRQEYMYEGLDRIATPDDYTVEVSFKEPFVPFLSFSGSERNPVVPREIYDQDGHLKDRIVGTGPFQLDLQASQKGTRWVFRKNPGYWDATKPYLDEVRWLVLSNDATAVAAFQTKQIDRLDTLEHQDYKELSRLAPDAQTFKYLQPYANNMRLSHVAGKPTTDARVRRALTLALDRDEINRVFAGGEGAWALSGAYVGLFSDAEIKALLRYDPAEAARLLAEAGYPGGLNLDLVTDDVRSPAEMTLFQLLQAQLKKANVNVEIKIFDRATQRVKRRSGDYGLDITTGQGSLVGVDNDSILVAQFHSASAANDIKVKDPELDRLVEAQRREPDLAKRRELLRAAVKRIADQVLQIGLIYVPKWEMVQPYVKENYPHFSTRSPYLTSWISR